MDRKALIGRIGLSFLVLDLHRILCDINLMFKLIILIAISNYFAFFFLFY
jgi:hypothetical protein